MCKARNASTPSSEPPLPPFAHHARDTTRGKISAKDFGVKIRDIGVKTGIRRESGKSGNNPK